MSGQIPVAGAKEALRPASGRYAFEPQKTTAFPPPLGPDGIRPQECACGGGGGACSCGGGAAPAAPSYVYLIGSIDTVFPSLSVEKEYYQALEPGEPPTPLFNVLSKAENLYIAREMCWRVTKDNVVPYILIPRSEQELIGMIAATAPRGDAIDFDVVVGGVGPVAPPEMCNGLEVPTVLCDEAFDFTDQEYIQAIMTATGASKDDAANVFYTVMKMADNTGNTDTFRAVNFLAVRYLQVYVTTYQMLKQPPPPYTGTYDLSLVQVQPSPVQGNQKVVDVIFNYLGQTTLTTVSWFCRVDVSGEFPFLVMPMTRYYQHP